MTVEEMRKRKRELGLTNGQIAARSGVPLGTVQKVFGGGTPSPRFATLRALEKAFREDLPPEPDHPQTGKTRYDTSSPATPSVREPEPAYSTRRSPAGPGEKRQGEYTLEDYLAWPEDQRIELIDGVIYDMAAPTLYHQIIAGQIYRQMCNYVSGTGHFCTPFISPADVQLDRDIRTVVQPDVFAICDPDRLKSMLAVTQGKRLFGAPDFAVEVLSPSTRAKDILIKAGKYQRAGVKEYWTVDPDQMTVMVYLFEKDDLKITPYTFDDMVPVNVSGGECRIDFSDIRRQLEQFMSPGQQ